MLLRDWMTDCGLSDAALAAQIGGISPEMVRKPRFQARGTSVRVAARIDALSGGKVRAHDLLPAGVCTGGGGRRSAT